MKSIKFTIRKVQREWEVLIDAVHTGPYFYHIIELETWCEFTFGPGGRNSRYRWRRNWTIPYPARFYFKTEKDATFFMLRWA